MGVVEIIMFFFLLVMALYNTYRFLYQQKRYRIYFISMFYIFAYFVIIIRIAIAVMVVYIASDFVDYEEDDKRASNTIYVFLTFEIIAAYAKVCMGYFQVAAIIILTFQVKQIFQDSIDSISKWLYFGMTCWCIGLIIGAIIFTLYVLICPDQDDPQCFEATDIGIILNGANFVLLGLLLTLSMVPLILALNNLSKGTLQLTKGVKMLTAVFAVFTFCYVTRAIFDLTSDPNLNFPNLFYGLLLPLLWDWVPIFMMFVYHYKNAKLWRIN